MATVIELRDVSKSFSLDSDRRPLLSVVKHVLGGGQQRERMHSLRQLNLTIERGDKIGLIGHNGAGKTTLLKLLAGLYRQTSGQLQVRGRITFLAGFGIGMLEEMSVLDNTYLYAAIYGIARERVHANLDEILTWAELDEVRHRKFKHLSAGMKIRLAFSITRYFDADIYLLDEALSAGDEGFRNKCNQVFEEYRNTPRTMIIASHNMTFVESFCDKTLWLKNGALTAFGDTAEVVAAYLDQAGSGSAPVHKTRR